MSAARTARRAAVFALLLAGAWFAAPPRAFAGDCVTLSPAQMALDPAYVVPDGAPLAIVVQLPSPGTIAIPPGGAAVVGLQIAPPEMLNPEEAFVPGTDYTACIDPATGEGQITFAVAAPYFVRVTYADARVDHFVVLVATMWSATGATSPPRVAQPPVVPIRVDSSFHEVSGMPQGTKIYADSDFTGEPSGATTLTSLDAVINQLQIHDAPDGRPAIDLALRFHGTGDGTFRFGTDEISVGSRNFLKLCEGLKRGDGTSRVKSLTLLTCWGGKDQKGCELMQKLSQCIGGGKVRAATGMVASTWRGPNLRFVQNGTQVETGSQGCP